MAAAPERRWLPAMRFLILQQIALAIATWAISINASPDARAPFFVLAGVWQALLIACYAGHIWTSAHRGSA